MIKNKSRIFAAEKSLTMRTRLCALIKNGELARVTNSPLARCRLPIERARSEGGHRYRLLAQTELLLIDCMEEVFNGGTHA